jgi:hypothetical protein
MLALLQVSSENGGFSSQRQTNPITGPSLSSPNLNSYYT